MLKRKIYGGIHNDARKERDFVCKNVWTIFYVVQRRVAVRTADRRITVYQPDAAFASQQEKWNQQGNSRGGSVGNRDVETPHHALRSVVYNAKKRLEKAGLPKCTYIVAEKGMLYWTDKIPVESDTEKFEDCTKKHKRQRMMGNV